MGLIATLNGNKILDARLSIPAWGVSYHDVTIDGEVTLTGSVTLQVSDLTIKAAVLTGGAAHGRSFYRLVAGAGGLAKMLPAKPYANDAGVKLATVLADLAQATGETFDATTIDQTARLGPQWTRPNDPGGRVLELVAPSAWFVGEDGKVRLGARPTIQPSAQVTATSQVDLARGTVTIATDEISGILPGLVIKGLTVVDVEHEVSEKGGLRTTVWGKQSSGTSRRLSALRAIIEQLDPNRKFRGAYEYRIVTQEGNRLNLQLVKVSTGMPNITRAFVRGGIPGISAQHTLGSRVLVTFVNADPGRPSVVGFEDPDGSGYLPISLALMGGGAAIGRVGDQVQVTLTAPEIVQIIAPAGTAGGPCSGGPITVTGSITAGSPRVTSG